MFRDLALVLALAIGACGTRPPEDARDRFDPAILGRWDVTVHADETYPSWFELVESNGEISGRLQGRVGHALELERVERGGRA